MDSSTFQITMDEFKHFHKIDRKLYSLLVINLERDPFESMHTLALWIWLERTCHFKNFIGKIVSQPNFFINELADEGAACLKCIEDNQFGLVSTYSSEIPLTQHLTRKDLTLQFFHENRDNANSEMRKILNEVCHKAFQDIMEKAMMSRSSKQPLIESKLPMVPSPSELSLSDRMSRLRLGGDMSTRRMKGSNVPYEERSMFLTFSKGYPVAEWEIREFFTSYFGDNIESIIMQDVKSNEQALYARVVFDKPGIVEFILKDEPKVKFSINGKHVWMRKYVKRNGKSSFP
ncbi:uncharacterized protein LOC107007018 [Solanum pennellii]|uniref:Uncharacterized protein LOC107007018 n=1 Tax=Solanum pennellii TaxID=28526 RepID=A0ABM1FS89_SOLPN|nr:uncharacterized protein LOC107007018 [Solanum pennellii]